MQIGEAFNYNGLKWEVTDKGPTNLSVPKLSFLKAVSKCRKFQIYIEY